LLTGVKSGKKWSPRGVKLRRRGVQVNNSVQPGNNPNRGGRQLMKFTISSSPAVLAIVVNLGHPHRRLAGHQLAQRSPVPAQRHGQRRGDDGLRRPRTRPGARFITGRWSASSPGDGIDFLESSSAQGISTSPCISN